MKNWQTVLGIWGVLIAMTFLSSCGQMIPILSTDTELKLGKGQEWSMKYIAVLPGEVQMFAQEYQAGLDQMVADAQAKGITASWQLLPPQANETNLSYQVDFSGNGYDLLNQYIFQSTSAITADPSVKDQAEFSFYPANSRFAQGQYNTFTLKSSKILLTNGNLLEDGSVRWVNPTAAMTATVSTARDLTWLWISLLGVGCVGLIVSGFGILRKPAPQRQELLPPVMTPQPSRIVAEPVQVKYCPQCGHQNPIEAGFCPQCGMKLP